MPLPSGHRETRRDGDDERHYRRATCVTRKTLTKRAVGVSSDFWERLDEAHDLSNIRQLHPVSCGPACGAMLLRNYNAMMTQSAVALA
jgi:hypothetical protein